MGIKQFTAVDSAILVELCNNSQKKMLALVESCHESSIDSLICDMVYKCKECLKYDNESNRKIFSLYRDLIIGNYSILLIKIYNYYAKKHSLDANDLIHVPYTEFPRIVKNYEKGSGVTFNSFMILSLHGYIRKYIQEDMLIYVNPNKRRKEKINPVYVGLTKTNDNGDELEYLHDELPYDFDSDGKLQYVEKYIKELSPDEQEMYFLLKTFDKSTDAYKTFAEIHGIKEYKAKNLLHSLCRRLKDNWPTHNENYKLSTRGEKYYE